jgi:signal transduction histidine kinase
MTPDRLKVLLVDDDEEDYFLTNDLISDITNCQIDLEWVSNYDTALQKMGSQAHDAYLLDYSLGARTGIELLSEAINLSVDAPKIMLTGLGSETLAVEAMRTGAADYIPKSVLTVESLSRVLINAVEKYRLRKAFEEKHQLLEHTNEKLAHRTEEIRRFYHNVSHELKTPLTAVNEFVSIVLDGLAGPVGKQQQEYLLIAKESCEQLAFRLNDLLDVTRLDTGKLRLTPDHAPISSTVENVLISLSLQAKDKGIQLDHEIQPGLDDIYIDHKRINQVLTNLLNNALKFTDRGGQVHVNLHEAPNNKEYIRISVEDTGRGIESEKLKRIFDRLYQINSDRGVNQEGLGLGLHISREIVRLHGGEMSVESTPGEGSIFSFTIPKAVKIDTSENTR